MVLTLANAGAAAAQSAVGAEEGQVRPRLLSDLPLWAQERRPAARRALVIGIEDYKAAASLDTPEADRDLVARRLRKLGFDVMSPTASALDRAAMLQQIDRFLDTISPGDIAVVYFSGHGIERDGKNYMVPSDAAVPERGREGLDLVSLDFVLDELRLAGVGFSVVLLDACRTDPFSGSPIKTKVFVDPSLVEPESAALPDGSTTAATGDAAPLDAGANLPDVASLVEPTTADAPATREAPGDGAAPSGGRVSIKLAKTDRPPRILVGYAARSGDPAYSLRGKYDTADRGSLWTRVMVEMLGRPGTDIYADLRETSAAITYHTDGEQVPWIAAGAPPEFMMTPSEAFRQQQEDTWILAASVMTPVREPNDLARYLWFFPASEFSYAARRRLFDLQESGAHTADVAPSETLTASIDRLAGNLVSPAFNSPGDGVVGIVANDVVVYDAPAAFLSRRQRLFSLPEGSEVQVLGSTLTNKSSSVLVGLGDGRVGYIDRVRTESVAVRREASATFAPTGAPGQTVLRPTLDIDPASLRLLRSARARIEIEIASPPPQDDPLDEERAQQLAYVRGLSLRRELMDLGARMDSVVVTIAQSGRLDDSAAIRIGEARGPQ